VNRDCVVTHRNRVAALGDFAVVRTITTAIATGLHLAALYAAFVTFGAWIAVGLYAVGGLTALLEFHVVRRIT
jgi:hypothetical protein